jgi:hypothetical protein
MLIFIDDSGDPGFKLQKGSSVCFVIALIIFDDELEAEKTSLAIKELRRNLKISDFFEFKFNKMNNKFKNSFINTVKDFNFRVRAIVVRKNVIYSPILRNNKETFYNHIIIQVLKHSQPVISDAKLKFDERGEKLLRDELRTYLSRELDNKNNNLFRDLKFVNSRQNTLIQLADVVAGSINHSYSGKSNTYLNGFVKSNRIEDIWEFK